MLAKNMVVPFHKNNWCHISLGEIMAKPWQHPKSKVLGRSRTYQSCKSDGPKKTTKVLPYQKIALRNCRCFFGGGGRSCWAICFMMFNGSPGCFWDPRAVITDSNRSTTPQDIGEERRFRPVWLKFTPGSSLPIPIFSLKVYEIFLSYQVLQEFWWHVSLQKTRTVYRALALLGVHILLPCFSLVKPGESCNSMQFRHKGKGVKFGSKAPSFQESFVANPSLDQWLPRWAPTSF